MPAQEGNAQKGRQPAIISHWVVPGVSSVNLEELSLS